MGTHLKIVIPLLVIAALSGCGGTHRSVGLIDRLLCDEPGEVLARQHELQTANQQALKARFEAEGLTPHPAPERYVEPRHAEEHAKLLRLDGARPFVIVERDDRSTLVVKNEGAHTLRPVQTNRGELWLLRVEHKMNEVTITQCGCHTNHGGMEQPMYATQYIGYDFDAQPTVAGVRTLAGTPLQYAQVLYTHQVGDDAPGCEPIP